MASVQQSRRPVRDGSEREYLAQLQRARILSAMVDVVLEHSGREVSVAHVVERSGVSRRTFYDLFADREECFLAAFEDALARIANAVHPAFESKRVWHERIRAGLSELLGLFDEDPGLGRFVLVESLAAGPRTLERRDAVLARLIAIVDEGRFEASAGSGLSTLSAEGIVGAVCSILCARLAKSAVRLTVVSPNGIPERSGQRKPGVVRRADWAADEHDRAAISRQDGCAQRN